MAAEKLYNFRKNYGKQSLDENLLPAVPEKLFDIWFNDAKEAGIPEPNAMILATTSADNKTTQRTVLLKEYSKRGFEFFTNYNSKKAKDISSNPHVSLLFLWLTIERQIRIECIAEKVSRKKSEAYFKTRPRESCINAWASPQSEVIGNINDIVVLKEKYDMQFEGQEVPCPDFWGGYLVKPYYYEFWQGGAYRFHDRIVYENINNNWTQKRLAP